MPQPAWTRPRLMRPADFAAARAEATRDGVEVAVRSWRGSMPGQVVVLVTVVLLKDHLVWVLRKVEVEVVVMRAGVLVDV